MISGMIIQKDSHLISESYEYDGDYCGKLMIKLIEYIYHFDRKKLNWDLANKYTYSIGEKIPVRFITNKEYFDRIGSSSINRLLIRRNNQWKTKRKILI